MVDTSDEVVRADLVGRVKAHRADQPLRLGDRRVLMRLVQLERALSPATVSDRRRVDNDLQGGRMQFAVLVYEKPGAYEALSAAEREQMTAEYFEIARLAG